MFVYKYESLLRQYVVKNFGSFFDFDFVAQEKYIARDNGGPRVDILGEDEHHVYLIELKTDRITERNIKQVTDYIDLYRTVHNPDKTIIGILAAPHCDDYALRLIHEHPALRVKIIDGVISQKRIAVHIGPGRPAMAPDEKRRNRSIKMSDDEWARIGELAKEAGLNISEYIRKQTLGK